jgi:hypothetical protein
MKPSLVLAAAALLTAASALAGPEPIIKQRAKELSNQNNVRQGVTPPSQPANPPQGAPTPAAPRLSPTLAKFQSDLAAITAGSTVTAEQKQLLASNLVAAAQAAKPSPEAAAKFVDGVTAAAVEKPLSTASRTRLVQELDAVLNPGKYPQAKLDGIFNDIQAIFQDNGLARAKAVAISDDVKAISAEIAKGGVR